jgi:hypothetical protein
MLPLHWTKLRKFLSSIQVSWAQIDGRAEPPTRNVLGVLKGDVDALFSDGCSDRLPDEFWVALEFAPYRVQRQLRRA